MAIRMALLAVAVLLLAHGSDAVGSVKPSIASMAWVRSQETLLKTAAITGLPDGALCRYNTKGVPQKPYCGGNKWNCMVTETPTKAVQAFLGKCNSKYRAGSFCKFEGIPYAVGTTGITGNPLCETCACKAFQDFPGTNKATCLCNNLPQCYVDYEGKPYGKQQCPDKQSMCVITKPGAGGKDRSGKRVDLGVCVYSGIRPICATGGKTWGPKFYLEGVVGVPRAEDRCWSCYCGRGGRMGHCQRLQGCNQK